MMTRDEVLDLADMLPEMGSMSLEDFFEWIDDPGNWPMYCRFRQAARDVIEAKPKRFSCYCIREFVRWKVEIEWQGDFKISNNLTPYFARLLAYEYSELREIFEFKPTLSKRELAI